MMTNEEILEQAHPNKSYMTPPSANYSTVYAAMDIARKETAIALIKFINERSVTPIQISDYPYHYTDEPTTIHNLFIEEQNKKIEP